MSGTSSLIILAHGTKAGHSWGEESGRSCTREINHTRTQCARAGFADVLTKLPVVATSGRKNLHSHACASVLNPSSPRSIPRTAVSLLTHSMPSYQQAPFNVIFNILFRDCVWGHGQRPRTVSGDFFIGTFAKLRKSTISFVMSVRPHLPLDGFSWNLIFEYFSKICRENSSFIKTWQE